ncbi:hypothetical protein ABMA27_009205 [Loxostege sticticalis]|uniref:Uncharacterized protein n=1 Tax=Loxostege sticticalis TaxID=481309 RepID=A0ABR3HA99_LOXSC
MCDIEVCRICLRNESKFYNLDEYDLKKYYEEVTNKSINKKDGLPQFFCYECAALLHKSHTFREKCEYGEKILKDMLWNGPLTYAGIYELNQKRLNRFKYLTLDVLVCNKRVKTFNYHHNEDIQSTQTLKTEIIDDNFTEGPFSDDDNFACNDPETDPVDLDLSFDVKDDKEKAITTDVTENKIDIVKTVEIDLKQVDKLDNEEEESKLAPQKTVKAKQNVKTRQKSKPKRNTKQKRRKPKPVDSDYDSDDIELSKIKSEKSTSVFSPETKKTYKFNKPKSTQRSFEFLNSENWKKSNLSDEAALEEFQKKALNKKYINAPYKCTLCFRGFSQKNMLDRHMPQRHHESVGPLVCRFCKMRFKSNYFVNKHLRQHYNKYECLRCGLVCCLENTALFHEEYHSGVKRKCPHCDKEFQHLSTFYTHLRTHRSKHMCSLCGESFVSELGLHLHRKAKHQVEIENNVVDIEGAIYCEVCKINFESKVAFQNHLAHSALHTEENKKLGEYLNAAEMMEAEAKRQEESTDTHVRGLVNRKSMVEKDLCAVRKSCKSRDSRISAKKSTVEKELCAVRKSGKSRESRRLVKKPTTCQHCDATFESLSAALRHHLAEHRGKAFYAERVICEICGASLAMGSVAAHLNQHTRRKMYTCHTCGRSFTTSNILKNHLVTHTGEKKHACSLCDKRFTQNGSLNLHYRTFHLKQPYPKRNRRKHIEKEEE